MDLGQRFTASITVIAVALIALFVGDTPESVQGMIMTIIAPMGTILATIFYLIKSIQNNVASGNIDPGDILAVLKRREFALSITVGSLFILQKYLGVQINEENIEQVIEVGTLSIMAVIGFLVRSYAERPNGERDPLVPVIEVEVGELTEYEI